MTAIKDYWDQFGYWTI